MARLQLFLFGKPRIEYDGVELTTTRRKSLALFVYLVMNPYPHSRDFLATLFWPDYDYSRARAGLRRALAELNELPLRAWIHADAQTISLATMDDLWVDAQEFTSRIKSDEARSDLASAVSLYRDHFMVGFTLPDSLSFDDWQALQMQMLQQKMTAALSALASHYQTLGDTDNALTVTRRLVAHEPYDEQARYHLIRLLAITGQRAAALQAYKQYAAFLERELQVEPPPQITELYEAIKQNRGLNAPNPRAIYCNLPSKPALVVGREDSLRALRDLLCQPDDAPRAPLVVQGWPGIGKTTLTALLAHDEAIRRHFSDGILWASLGEQPNLPEVLALWAGALGLQDADSNRPVTELLARLGGALAERRMLLIVDDVWKTDHAAVFQQPGGRCRVLFTTRHNDVALELARVPDAVFKLPILSEDDGLALLGKLTPEVVAKHPADSRELVRDLEGLPLALQVAGRLLHAEIRMGWGIHELIAELREGTKLLAAQAPPDRIDLMTQTIPSVAVLLQRSTDLLDAETRARFAYLGAFAPKPAVFDLDAMAAVWDAADARATVRVLVDRGLLEPAGDGQFQMHALLAMHARSLFAV